MYSWFLIALTVIFALIVAKLILKKYNAIFVFFASGVVILMTASLLTGTPILPKGSLGNVFLDTFGFLTATFKKNIAGIGTLIMVVTGYATYMKHIGASTKLAFTASRLLGGISNKYLILSAFYLIGMCLKLVLPSQASLAVLMLATVFPVFIALGIRPITAASVLALLCLDYGPNDGSTLFMANVAEMNVVDMFLRYQYKVVLSIVLVTAFLIPFYYRYMDRKDEALADADGELGRGQEIEDPSVPFFYVFLPLIPLLLVFAQNAQGNLRIFDDNMPKWRNYWEMLKEVFTELGRMGKKVWVLGIGVEKLEEPEEDFKKPHCWGFAIDNRTHTLELTEGADALEMLAAALRVAGYGRGKAGKAKKPGKNPR